MKKRGTLILAILLTGLMGAAWTLLRADTLSGHATDSTNGQALSGATVTVVELSQSKTTDVSGAYSFGTLPNGTYTVTAQAAGYTTQQKTVTLSSISPCDLNTDNSTNVSDIQICVNQAIGVVSCTTGDINKDGSCNVVDVQRIVNAVLSGTCVSP